MRPLDSRIRGGRGHPSRPRVVRLTNLLPPYRLPAWRILDGEPEVHFEIWLMARAERDRRWSAPDADLRVRVFADLGIDLSHREYLVVHFNPGVLIELVRDPPDLVILGGYDSLTCVSAALLLRRRGVPFLFAVESIDLANTWIGRRAPWLLRRIVAASAGALVPGRAARDHVLALGVPRDRIFVAPNSVDVERFRPVAADQRDEIRSALDLPEGVLCLYAGQLSVRKGLDVLLEAFRRSITTRPHVHLLLVGDGPLRRSLSRRIEVDPILRGRVHLVGYCPDDLLPSYYAAADIFVLPTRYDIWGMVLNEAMSSGLPVISSDRAGGALDLVDDGITGFRFEAENPEALATTLNRLLDDGTLRARVGRRAREKILGGYTPHHQAGAVMEAVLRTLNGNGRDLAPGE